MSESSFRSTSPLSAVFGGVGNPQSGAGKGFAEDVGPVLRISEPRVDLVADEPEVAVVAVDRLVAVRVHPAVDRRPRELRGGHVRIIRRPGWGKTVGRGLPARPIERARDDIDRDTEDRPVVPDERGVVRAVNSPVAGAAIVRLRSPGVAVELAVDDVRIAVEGAGIVAAVGDTVAVEVGPAGDNGRREASGQCPSAGRPRQHELRVEHHQKKGAQDGYATAGRSRTRGQADHTHIALLSRSAPRTMRHPRFIIVGASKVTPLTPREDPTDLFSQKRRTRTL
jgi:hypothetical protein